MRYFHFLVHDAAVLVVVVVVVAARNRPERVEEVRI